MGSQRSRSRCATRGTLTAVVGANGSGKSTLLRIAAGLVSPSGGVRTSPGARRLCPGAPAGAPQFSAARCGQYGPHQRACDADGRPEGCRTVRTPRTPTQRRCPVGHFVEGQSPEGPARPGLLDAYRIGCAGRALQRARRCCTRGARRADPQRPRSGGGRPPQRTPDGRPPRRRRITRRLVSGTLVEFRPGAPDANPDPGGEPRARTRLTAPRRFVGATKANSSRSKPPE